MSVEDIARLQHSCRRRRRQVCIGATVISRCPSALNPTVAT